jgi:cysteine sulfinate desulfinase/cysteine desulfurase-like protein
MDATSVTVNFAKAVEITKNRLRAERAPLLAAQDVLFQRALESNADTTAIVAEKERLRNITNITATTLDELRALKAEV